MKHVIWLSPFLLLVGCGSPPLQTGLSEHAAQEIAVTLRENGIPATLRMASTGQKGGETWQVEVSGGSEQQIAAWKILGEHGLPRQKVMGLDEVFASGGMIPTAGEEKARLLTGLSGELTRTLELIPGVAHARVHIVLPDNNPLLDKAQQTPATASVFVQYEGDRPPLKEEEIRVLVARGIEGLAPENVGVVLKQFKPGAIPPRQLGPLVVSQWIGLAGLVLSGFSGVCAFALVGLSRFRKHQIDSLERRIAAKSA
jgi:type III secretion protein J